mgnify:CR=1 FL=1
MNLGTSQLLYLLFLALVTAERLVELRLSRRNADRALSKGGVEYGQGHFRAMTLLHSLFLAGCAAEVLFTNAAFSPLPGLTLFTLALAAQGLRYWAISSLGHRWNVRVIVLPGEPAVGDGPYRWMRHPNYLAVILEGVAIPMIHGAWITALTFSLLNAALLTVRIRCEEQALARHCDYQDRLGRRRRFLPVE